MRQIRQFSVKHIGAILPVCSCVILLIACPSQGRFLSRKYSQYPPRIRMGSYASSTIGTNFMGPGNLGKHRYRYSWMEQNGIMYTCKAGHIDTAHLRKAADWTAYLASRIFYLLMDNKEGFSFKMKEPSVYYVRFKYPEYWKDLPPRKKARIAYEVSIGLGKYLSFSAATWHEILTWFGYKITGFYSEFPSAFSWEDSYSNALGCRIGEMALRDTKHKYNRAMTLAIKSELRKLDVQSKQTARHASEKVKGLWFSGDFLFFVTVKSRNFDIGLDDGYVTPRLIPSISRCEEATPQPCPVPNLDFLSRYGFSFGFRIEPREWEKDRILSVVYPDPDERKSWVDPIVSFPVIMDRIVKEAHKNHYDDAPQPRHKTYQTTLDFLNEVLR
jgi:hypothetical protein